jgi:hypothetical protein
MRASAAVAEAASRRCAILPALELGGIAADVATLWPVPSPGESSALVKNAVDIFPNPILSRLATARTKASTGQTHV